MLHAISTEQLPPPRTFAEGQRYIYGLLAAAAGIFCGAAAVAMVCLLMWGGLERVRAAHAHPHLRLGAWRVHCRDGGGHHRPSCGRPGRPVQACGIPQWRNDRGRLQRRRAMIGRFLNPQGIAGIAVAAALAVLLLLAKSDARHWHKQATQYEQLYRGEQAAFATTVANYRAAADAARQADRANAQRVAAQQSVITERIANDFQVRLADARARAAELRQNPRANADSRTVGSPPVPGLSDPAGGIANAAREDRLPRSDQLIATEQAIQLDELIKWVRAQAQVDNNAPAEARSAR